MPKTDMTPVQAFLAEVDAYCLLAGRTPRNVLRAATNIDHRDQSMLNAERKLTEDMAKVRAYMTANPPTGERT